MEFRFDPKGRRTVAVQNGKVFSLDDATNRRWFNPIDTTTVPLRESAKTSHYWWELPYGESYEFSMWLSEKYNNGKSVPLYPLYIGKVRLSLMRTRNEVGEPYFGVTAKLPYHVLRDILECIMQDYFYHQAKESGFDPVVSDMVPDSMNGLTD